MALASHIVFPAPSSTYTPQSFPNELIWIPLNQSYSNCTAARAVPALLLRSPAARYLVLFFHSNAEDLGICRSFCKRLRTLLEVHVLMVEYPGYGLAPGESSEESLLEAGRAAFLFASETLNWPASDIILMGRSLGAAVAIQLATAFECQGLILVAPFLSILGVFDRFLGGFASALVDDIFANDVHIEHVRVPTLVIHGQKDLLVPCTHGRRLYDLCQTRKELVCPASMDHNTDLLIDAEFLARPVLRFFNLPDYRFKEMVVPPSAFDKRLCPLYVQQPDAGKPRLPTGDTCPCDVPVEDIYAVDVRRQSMPLEEDAELSILGPRRNVLEQWAAGASSVISELGPAGRQPALRSRAPEALPDLDLEGSIAKLIDGDLDLDGGITKFLEHSRTK